MHAKFETYFSSASSDAKKSFMLVAFGEGQGEFKVTRKLNVEGDAFSYLVRSVEDKTYKIEKIYPRITRSLEELFENGALSISYVQGDSLIEFPEEISNKFTQDQLASLADMALSGMKLLAADFIEHKYSVDQDKVSSTSYRASTFCIYIVLGISLILVSYGSNALPLEWLKLTAYCLGFAILVAIVFRGFTYRLIQTGKIFTLCFFGSLSVFLMLIAGVASLECAPYPIEKREGILESVLEGSKYKVIRVRLASDPHRSYLISKDYLNQNVERLPQVILITIQPGFFGARYVKKLETM